MIEDIFSYDIVNGKSLEDLLTLEAILGLLGSVAAAFAILIIGLWIAGFLAKRVRRMGERHQRLDGTLFNFLGQIVRYTVMAFTALFILNTFGVQTTSIVALIGAAGLAIGLALQGTLSNLAAGVMLILFRPITQGDFVEVAGQMGTVKDITLNYTELASLSNVQIIIPNSEVWSNTITNYSAYPDRRAEWTFGVGYGANLAAAQHVILDTILADDRARSEPEPYIAVTNLGDSTVDFLVRVWCCADDYFAFTNDMKRAVKEALDEAGIDIPYPTRTLIVEGETPV